MKTSSIGIILLAAGASERLGEPKQLLRFRHETLLRKMAKNALAVSDKVVATLGANIEITRKEIADLPVQLAENINWKSGMSGSIKIGLEKLLDVYENLNAVIVLVCDQPFVDENLLETLIETFEKTDSLIVACEYADTVGVPALFHRKIFPELLALDAQTGAKALIKKYQSEMAIVSFPAGAFDIDTPADYEDLIKNFN